MKTLSPFEKLSHQRVSMRDCTLSWYLSSCAMGSVVVSVVPCSKFRWRNISFARLSSVYLPRADRAVLFAEINRKFYHGVKRCCHVLFRKRLSDTPRHALVFLSLKMLWLTNFALLRFRCNLRTRCDSKERFYGLRVHGI
jgi:hypothetical protein